MGVFLHNLIGEPAYTTSRFYVKNHRELYLRNSDPKICRGHSPTRRNLTLKKVPKFSEVSNIDLYRIIYTTS